MRPLGQTRPLLAYGLPAAAGLAVGGALAGQGQEPGVAALGGLAGALGARGGLGAARLAGKYSTVLPNLVSQGLETAVGKSGRSIRNRIEQQIINSPEYMKRGQAKTLYSPKTLGNIARTALLEAPASLQASAKPLFTAGLVPTSAALAGLGGAAAGMIPGALGVPGFAQGVDPEAYGSSNSEGARYKVPTTQYV